MYLLIREQWFSIWIVAILSLLQGCATTADKTAAMRNLILQGQYEPALVLAEKLAAKSSDGVMENMNLGMLQHLLKNFEASNQAFARAKKTMDALYASSLSEHAASFFINDEAVSYQGERFEQWLIHFYMALNYLHLGQLDEARVELMQSQLKIKEWGYTFDQLNLVNNSLAKNTPAAKEHASVLSEAASQGLAFMQYFTAVVFEMLGEQDSALVFYRQALALYLHEKNTLSDIPSQLKKDIVLLLAELKQWDEYRHYTQLFGFSDMKPLQAESEGELILLLGQGLISQRQQSGIHVWSPVLSHNIRIAIPAYTYAAPALSQLYLSVNGQSTALQSLSHVDQLARRSLDKRMPAITARALARAVIKKKSEKNMSGKQGDLGQLALLLFNQFTEIADTRGWNTLPQVLSMARVKLPPGEHEIVLQAKAVNGSLYDVLRQTIKLMSGQKILLSEHWLSGYGAQQRNLPGMIPVIIPSRFPIIAPGMRTNIRLNIQH